MIKLKDILSEEISDISLTIKTTNITESKTKDKDTNKPDDIEQVDAEDSTDLLK